MIRRTVSPVRRRLETCASVVQTQISVTNVLIITSLIEKAVLVSLVRISLDQTVNPVQISIHVTFAITGCSLRTVNASPVLQGALTAQVLCVLNVKMGTSSRITPVYFVTAL